MTIAKKTYGRGQVEWALWRAFARASSITGDMPKVFGTRVKRLLEIDRDLDLSGAEVQPTADFAFAPPSAESGEVAYRAVDAFCLAIAVDLLDAGFKQSEVAFLMRYLRSELEERFPRMLSLPSLTSRQRLSAEDNPDLPTFEQHGLDFADARVFVILKKIELTEIIPQHARKAHPDPVILEPVFCAGVTALGKELHHSMPDHRRSVTILELASTAQAVQTYLDEAPVIRRGRPRAQTGRK